MKVTVQEDFGLVTLETSQATAGEMYSLINRALLALGYDMTICEIIKKDNPSK